MSNSLTDKFIDDTYPGLLHANGSEIPATGKAIIYDGNGNKTPLKLGRDGNGVELGELDYPTSNGGAGIGAVVVQTEQNKLTLTAQQTFYGQLLNFLHPVGSVMFSTEEINPQTRFTGTTWEHVSQGRYIAGVGTSIDNLNNSKTIVAGNINGVYEYDSIDPHRHGVGQFLSSDDHYFIVNNWSDGNTYRLGRTTGEDPYVETTGDGSFRGTMTSEAITTSSSPRLNNPPGFGLYVWKRTS